MRVTWVSKLAIFKELGNPEDKEQETGTESRESKNRDTQFFSYINRKTKHAICNNTSDGWAARRSSIIVGDQKLSKQGAGDLTNGFTELPIGNIAGFIRREAVRNRVEVKRGKLGGEAVEVVDATVVVVGVEEGDTETGVAEELGEREEGSDVAFGRKGKKEEMMGRRKLHGNG